MDPLLSILIVNWNTRDLLLDCLRSLREAAIGVPHELIVVDNASSDGSAAAVAGAFPEARLIESAENLGFAGANNRALAESRGELLLLLNPDTVVSPGQIERMLAYLAAHPRCGILGPKLLNPDGSFQLSAVPFIEPWDVYWEYARFPRTLQPQAQRAPRRLYPFEPWRAMAVDYVIGAVFLIRRAVVEAVGPMDERYFMYGEEQDWCYRAKEAGFEVHFDPESAITHLGGQATGLVPFRMLAHRFESSFRFMRKHRGAAALGLTRGLLAVAALQNTLLTAVRFAARRDDAATFRHQLRGHGVVLKTAISGRVPVITEAPAPGVAASAETVESA